MNPLQEAIRLLTKEEVRAFKLFIQKVNTKADRKDIELFDNIRKAGIKYDENQAFEKLYSETSKNTFHRLKSRLLHDINRAMIDLHLENNDTLRLWHFLSVTEFYFGRRQFELAHWFLRKAESLAEKMHNHEALDIIYSNYIRLSHQVFYINPEEYIVKRKENQQELQQIRELDDILAAAVYRTKFSQTWGGGGGELMKMLEETVADFGLKEKRKQSPALRIKLFQSISNILINRRDYKALETYVSECYHHFEEDGIFTRNTHEIKLLMLTYRANALHKLGDYEGSLKQAETLGRAMKDYESAFQDQYLFFFYNVLIINYFKTNIDKALALLEEMQRIEKIMETPFYVLFIDMNLALVWREKGNYKKAIKYIVQAVNHEAYRSAAPGLMLRIAIAELMIRLKLDQYDVLLLRLRQVQNDFSAQLDDKGFRREAKLLELIAALNEGEVQVHKKPPTEKIQQFLKMTVTEEERDSELIGYNDFIKEFLSA